MTRRIILENQDHEWMVETLEAMIRKANQNISVWLERLPQLERVRDALYAAQPGFEELWPDEPAPVGNSKKAAAPAKRGRKPRAVSMTAPAAKVVQKPEKSAALTISGEKKPRAKRGERLATLPNLCSEHPAYGAKRAPRTNCEGCWKAYEKYVDPAVVEKAKRKLGYNQGVGE